MRYTLHSQAPLVLCLSVRESLSDLFCVYFEKQESSEKKSQALPFQGYSPKWTRDAPIIRVLLLTHCFVLLSQNYSCVIFTTYHV